MAVRLVFMRRLLPAWLGLTLVCLNFLTLSSSAQANYAGAYLWTTLAGTAGGGYADGVGDNARFSNPQGAVVDSAGNVYVADAGNAVIRKITPAGIVSTIIGKSAGQNSDGTNAVYLSHPQGLALDGAGNLYLSDYGTIRRITPNGTNWVVTTLAGSLTNSGSADGTNNNASFRRAGSLVVDSATNIYVTDTENFTIRKITPTGTNWVVTTIAGMAGVPGSTDGTNSEARFGSSFPEGPVGIEMGNANTLFVTDSGNHAIRRVRRMGTNWVVTTIAGQAEVSGSADGTNNAAKFFRPFGICRDGAGNLYVADSQNDSIRKLSPVGTNWVVETLAGATGNYGADDGTGGDAQFFRPFGVTVDTAGTLYVTDANNDKVRRVTSAGVVNTIAGVSPGGSTDGTGDAARFDNPCGLAVDAAGKLYLADTFNNTIRQVTTAGIVSTMAGQAPISGTNDGIGSNARFNVPRALAVDASGNVYVADTENQTIRQITLAGVVTTIAGTPGSSGNSDGTNSAARFHTPAGIAVDGATNLYVADTDNHVIRKIVHQGTNWIVSTISGLASTSGSSDGTNRSARFNRPVGIMVDSAINLYVVDHNNQTIRKITPVGTNWVTSTLAGKAGIGDVTDGIGTNATFYFPPGYYFNGIGLDPQGSLYVGGGGSIRKITPAGTNWVVSTIGGGASSPSVDGAGSDSGFAFNFGIAANAVGTVYVADTFNNTIRQGVFAAFAGFNPAAYTPPAMNVGLKVVLLPPEANGQWRFPWEVAWRNSGQSANNLVAGNYSVEFRNVPGWLAVPSGYDVVAVTNNGTTLLTNFYYPTLTAVDTNSGGSLTVNIGPSPPGGVGWRFLGDTTPYFPTGYRTNLVTGIYLIEFAPVAGFSQPPSQAVQVLPGLPTVLSVTYRLASTPPGGVQLPFPVPPANLNNPGNYPFAFNGQLQTDIGYGSGVAVDANVVLTAAHLIFNDQSLSYVNQTWWFFQRQAGVFEPLPLSARSIYMLTGYASQRTNDVRGGLGPEQSSPQSRNFDVAALYFDAPVAGGGYGGYLPSDAVPNPWLTGNSLKMLAGYPVDGSQFGVSIVPGKMHQTTPQPYALNLASDQVTNQQVYTASWFLSYPGNSGGPLYAQLNGYYYPAAVYLGTLYNGVVPYASVVRAIDSNVVNLITLAATQGATGTNHSGGGVITIVPNQSISAANPGYVQFTLSPPAAVAAGAGWRLSGDTAYSSATNYTRAVLTTNAFSVQFQPVAGWNVPTNQAITVQPGQINYGSAFYTVTNPMLMASGAALGLTGTTGTMYRLERRSSLTSGSWQPVSTNTISSGGFNLFLANPATNGSVNFYRAVWLP